MEKITFCTLFFVITRFVHINGILHLDSECSQSLNSSENTVYQTNLKTLLNSLLKDAPLQGGFANTTSGNGTDRVHGLAWCRADVSPITCSSCLNESIIIPLKDCPESKDLVIWSSLCSLRFSNKTFFGEVWNRSSSSSYGGNKLEDSSVFSRGFLMMEALGRSVSDKPLMFESGVIDVGDGGMRYGLGQCSRDLSRFDCENCLVELLKSYRTYVLNRTGWEMLGVSCGMWYDDVRFSDNDLGLTPTPVPSGGGERWYKRDVILAFVAFLLFNRIA